MNAFKYKPGRSLKSCLLSECTKAEKEWSCTKTEAFCTKTTLQIDLYLSPLKKKKQKTWVWKSLEFIFGCDLHKRDNGDFKLVGRYSNPKPWSYI